MKKISVSLIVVIFMNILFTSGVFAYEKNNSKDFEIKLSTLEVLGIIENIKDYELNQDGFITKGEAAKMAVRASGYTPGFPAQRAFNDVDSTDEFYEFINAAFALGLMGGDGNGNFNPRQEITYAQMLTVLVKMLGYKFLAEEAGGYPSGYLVVAGNIQLIKGVRLNLNDKVTREAAANLFYNSLDIEIMEQVGFSGKESYVISGKTLFGEFLVSNNYKKNTGVVTGNKYGSLSGKSLSENQVEIDSNLYIMASDKLIPIGSRVVFYINENDSSSSIFYIHEYKSVELDISEKDINHIDFKKVEYYQDEKLKTAKFSNDMTVVYNNKPAVNLDENSLRPLNGTLVLRDYDNDGNFDVLNIKSYVYAKVKSIGAANKIVHFYDEIVPGKDAISLKDSGDQNIDIFLNGEEAEFEDIKEECVLKLCISENTDCITIDILTETTEAVIESIDNSNGELRINGESFYLAKTKAGDYIEDINSLRLNKTYTFAFDGNLIVSITSKKNTGGRYGYIIAVGEQRGLSRDRQLKLVDEDKNILILTLAELVVCDGKAFKKDNAVINSDTFIYFELNGEGQIKSIQNPMPHGVLETKKFDKKNQVFTSMTYKEPTFLDDETKIFVVPESGEEEDYLAAPSLVNGETYEVLGYDLDEDSNTVKAVVINMNISFETPGVLNENSPFGVLTKKAYTRDEAGEETYKLSFVSENEEREYYVKAVSKLLKTVHKMYAGDIFRYSLNSLGYIDNIEIVCSLNPLPKNFHGGMFTINENVLGTAVKTRINSLQKGSRKTMVNSITLAINDENDLKTFLIPISEDVYYYLYDTEREETRVCSFEDIISGNILGNAENSKVFINLSESEAKLVVIIK